MPDRSAAPESHQGLRGRQMNPLADTRLSGSISDCDENGFVR